MGGQSSRIIDQRQAKAPTGIQGFDRSTNGGLPRGRTSLVMGGPGSGKTVFALQTLVHGARQWGEPGIFVAFEENSRQIVANAASFGWDLPTLERDKLFFLDARMAIGTITAGNFDLAGMLASLGAKVNEMGARRIVFDSIDVLLLLLDDPVLECQEIYRRRAVRPYAERGILPREQRAGQRRARHSQIHAVWSFCGGSLPARRTGAVHQL